MKRVQQIVLSSELDVIVTLPINSSNKCNIFKYIQQSITSVVIIKYFMRRKYMCCLFASTAQSFWLIRSPEQEDLLLWHSTTLQNRGTTNSCCEHKRCFEKRRESVKSYCVSEYWWLLHCTFHRSKTTRWFTTKTQWKKIKTLEKYQVAYM